MFLSLTSRLVVSIVVVVPETVRLPPIVTLSVTAKPPCRFVSFETVSSSIVEAPVVVIDAPVIAPVTATPVEVVASLVLPA